MEKINILNIATILPFPENNCKFKLKENNFLIVLSKYLERKGITSDFIKVANFSNRLLSKLSIKWDAYYNIPLEYYIDGKKINVIRKIVFPKDRLKTISFFITVLFNKKKIDRLYQKKYTCSHAHYLLIDGYFSYYLYRKYNLPYVLTVRDETKIFNNIILSAIAQKILDNAKYILTTNHVNKRKLEKYTNRDINIITHGIDAENLYFNPKVNTKIIITTVCKLDLGKRIDILLLALKNINSKNYILNIIGDGPEFEYLNSISNGVNCEFLGELKHEEVIKNLKESDIFILPSESESFGRVYIEALASSNAVVAVEGTGIYGLFENDKEVIYMKKNSIESLQKILVDLLSNRDKIRDLKINGYNSVKKDYTWDSIANKYYDI